MFFKPDGMDLPNHIAQKDTSRAGLTNVNQGMEGDGHARMFTVDHRLPERRTMDRDIIQTQPRAAPEYHRDRILLTVDDMLPERRYFDHKVTTTTASQDTPH